MKRSQWLLCSCFLMLATALHAQDRIHKMNGEVIEAKIKMVSPGSVTYVWYSNPEGPEYVLSKQEIAEIDYQNGYREVFHRQERRPAPMPTAPMAQYPPQNIRRFRARYGRNVLAIAPLQFTENGVGTSITYERTLDRAGVVSFYAPVVLTFDPKNDESSAGYKQSPAPMFYMMPGIKFYPTSNQGIVKYAIGPSLVYGVGRVYSDGAYTSINPDNSSTLTRTVFGMILNNSVNINPTPHFFIGAELGMGASYINEINGYSRNIRFLVQTAFRLGYRF
jgi:hypothetical protein